MAAPTVRGRTAPVAGLSATSPGGTAIGDAVIVFTWEQTGAGIPTHTLQTGFVELISHSHNDGSTDGRLSVAYKIATSSGANSYAAYTSSSGTTVRTGIIVLEVGTHSLGTTQKGAAAAAGVTLTTNAVPDPPSVTLGTSRDWLVAVVTGWHMTGAATVTPTAPTNYSNLQHVSGSSASEVASAERALTAPASENPGTWNDDVSPNGSASVTIGLPNPVERSAAVGATGAVTVPNREFFSIESRAAAVGATGLVAVAGVVAPAPVTHSRSAAIGATGAVAVAGAFFSIESRAVAVAATGAIAVAGLRIVERSASLSATASIATSATFFSILERSAALGATGAIASTFTRVLVRSASLSATGAIAATPAPSHNRSASLSATGAIASSATFLSVVERSASLTATAGIASSATFLSILERSSSLTASGSIATGRLVVSLRSASLTASAGIAVAGEIAGAVTRSVALNAVGGIAASGRNATTARAVSVSASASLTVAGSVVPEFERSASLEAVASIAVRGSVTGQEVVEFPVSRAPVLSTVGAGRLGSVAAPGLEVGSTSVAILAPAGNGRILSPDDPRLEVA